MVRAKLGVSTQKIMGIAFHHRDNREELTMCHAVVHLCAVYDHASKCNNLFFTIHDLRKHPADSVVTRVGIQNSLTIRAWVVHNWGSTEGVAQLDDSLLLGFPT